MQKRLTTYILIAMVLGIIVGAAIHSQLSAEQAKTCAGYLGIITDLFLRMIKMIIAPLVLATLIGGIAHMGAGGSVGRIGVRTIGWFLGASILSLTLGLVMVNVLQPGVGLGLPLPEATADAGVATTALNLKDFITHLVPKSIFEAMATNEVLQIVVFSVFAGVALTSIGDKGAPIVRGLEALTHMMLRVTDFVMWFAPAGVFAAIAAAVATHGLEILSTYVKFLGGFYLALLILWVILLSAGAFVIGGKRALMIPRYVREPLLIAFSTASSEAAFPRLLEQLERYGVRGRIAGFVLPLGYSFNLDGSMMYCAFATVFIAQAYGIDLTLAQEFTMLGLLLITSKGIAAVPRASLVVIAATLPFFNIPGAGLLLILGIDVFLDMGRTATNVIGNAVASAVVAKWEGVLEEPFGPDGELEPKPAVG